MPVGRLRRRGRRLSQPERIVWHDRPSNQIPDRPDARRPNRENRHDESYQRHIHRKIAGEPGAHAGNLPFLPRPAQLRIRRLFSIRIVNRRCTAIRAELSGLVELNATPCAKHRASSIIRKDEKPRPKVPRRAPSDSERCILTSTSPPPNPERQRAGYSPRLPAPHRAPSDSERSIPHVYHPPTEPRATASGVFPTSTSPPPSPERQRAVYSPRTSPLTEPRATASGVFPTSTSPHRAPSDSERGLPHVYQRPPPNRARQSPCENAIPPGEEGKRWACLPGTCMFRMLVNQHRGLGLGCIERETG